VPVASMVCCIASSQTLDAVELFRRQVILSSASLHKSEDIHGTATEAIKAALNEARSAKIEHSDSVNGPLQTSLHRFQRVHGRLVIQDQRVGHTCRETRQVPESNCLASFVRPQLPNGQCQYSIAMEATSLACLFRVTSRGA
jgi:hypothetical protein